MTTAEESQEDQAPSQMERYLGSVVQALLDAEEELERIFGHRFLGHPAELRFQLYLLSQTQKLVAYLEHKQVNNIEGLKKVFTEGDSENSKRVFQGVAQRLKQREFREEHKRKSSNLQPSLQLLSAQSIENIIADAGRIKSHNDMFFENCNAWYKTMHIRIKAKFPRHEETGVMLSSKDCPVLAAIHEGLHFVMKLASHMDISEEDEKGPLVLWNLKRLEDWPGWNALSHKNIGMQQTSSLNPMKDISIVEEIHRYEMWEDKEFKDDTEKQLTIDQQLSDERNSLSHECACQVNAEAKVSLAQEALKKATAAGDKAPWGRAKLMVVGQGRAGKTSTVRRLLGRGFNANEASTLGLQTQQEFSVDLTRTVNGFVEIDPEEDFLRRQVTKLARLRYQNAGKAKDNEKAAGPPKLLAVHQEIFEEESFKDLLRGPETVEGVETRQPEREKEGQTKEEEEEEQGLARRVLEEELDVARRYSESIFGTIIDGEEETKVQLTIWDYGGQRVFYALHHLFLTEYGVYMLVFDMREVLYKEDDAIEYLQFWLKSIALHAPSAPIVLAGTYRDEVGETKRWKDIDTVLRNRVKVVAGYTGQLVPNSADGLSFFPVDNCNDKGLTDVREAILVGLTGKEFMEYPVPLSWISCLDQLLRSETGSAGYMGLSEVEAIARKHRVNESSEVRLMLSFFHEIGSLFYFHRSKKLRDIVILDTQWLVDALTCLIFDNDVHTCNIFDTRESLRVDEEMFLNTGVLSERLRKSKWQKGEYPPNVQQKLLSLMEGMLLLCKWPWHESQGALLVPSILLSGRSLNAPEENETIEDVRQLQGPSCEIDFGNSFLPDGLFQRLVCQCATFSEIFCDESQDPPIVRGRAALIDFGEAVTFGMLYVVTENKIVVIVAEEESSPGAAPKLVKHLNSMLQALKDDFMGRNLVWQLNLNSSARPELFVSYERILDARKSQKTAFKYMKKRHNVDDFEAWFGSEGAVGLGDLRKEDTQDLVEYEQDVAQRGLSYALHQVSSRTERKALPSSLSFHCFISYKQVGGSEIATTLFFLLASMGYTPWFDQSRDEITGRGMLEGVRDSAVYILVLSKDVFKSNAVLKEARKARELGKPIIAVYENDPRRMEGYSSFDEYLNTVPEDLKTIFNEEEALPHQRRFYLLRATIQEIDRRIMKRMVN